MFTTIQEDALQDLQDRVRLVARISARIMNLMTMQMTQSIGALTVWGKTGQNPTANMPNVFEDAGVKELTQAMLSQLATNPLALWPRQVELAWDMLSLWQHTTLRMMGWPSTRVSEPPKGDKRFKGPSWQDNLFFDAMKQAYLLASRHILASVGEFGNLPAETQRKLLFYTRHFVDALSPSNFFLTNPEVLEMTHKTMGKNLLQGLDNLLEDIEKGGGKLQISMTDTKAFSLGENIAATPGKVVFQNRMFQLIQYAPTTPNALARPLLIIPPWINRYYILDLQPKTSFIRWAVAQGHSVFVMSWVNPDATLADVSFENYMQEGALTALRAVEQQTGAKKINVIGYCLGGTLLAMTLAWLARDAQPHSIASATFFTTLIDFSEPGDLLVYLDEQRIALLEKKMAHSGYLEGSEMAASFNLLRANDLIWSFVVNNYLLGKTPFPFDLLYWNADSTRMPARMHSEYLRNMYLRNCFKDADVMQVAGRALDVRRIDLPTCFVSAIEDHIAPWKTTYLGARLMRGPTPHFILSGSGHIAGIINPPEAKKYGYWVRSEEGPLPATADKWFAKATAHEGSWWPQWHEWVRSLDSKQVIARDPAHGKLKPLQDAPGDYVRRRFDAESEATRELRRASSA